MPTRKPKRTNWKKAYADLVNATVALVTKWEEQIKSLESRLNSALSDCAAEHQARLAAERHNAELLKEREELRRDNGDLFLRLERFRTGLDKPEKEYCLCGETAPDCKCEQKFGKPQSWLQRVWRKWRA